jgi:hypothetical protein
VCVRTRENACRRRGARTARLSVFIAAHYYGLLGIRESTRQLSIVDSQDNAKEDEELVQAVRVFVILQDYFIKKLKPDRKQTNLLCLIKAAFIYCFFIFIFH